MNSAAVAAIESDGVVRVAPLLSKSDFLSVIQPAVRELSLLEWAATRREPIRELLQHHGAILFRGFRAPVLAADFQRFIELSAEGTLLEYSQGSTPRETVSGKIATATLYPADRPIPLHSELSYARSWPLKLWFYCQQPAEKGGATPLADNRRVIARIDPQVIDRFGQDGVMYVRNYRELIDVPWQKAFLTDDRSQVEKICERDGVEFEWHPEGGLRTTQVCQAIAEHPQTNEKVWFNQAHLFHASNLAAPTRKQLIGLFGERDLPRNAYFGDGSPIDDAALDSVRTAYEQERLRFSWQVGDLLMLDNMLAAHGREPFGGERTLWVGMAEAHSLED